MQKQKGTKIQGQIVRVQGPDRFVVRTADKREVILLTNPQTRFLVNDRVVRFTDLREGAEVTTVYDVTGDQNFANSVTIVPAAEPAAVPAAETAAEPGRFPCESGGNRRCPQKTRFKFQVARFNLFPAHN